MSEPTYGSGQSYDPQGYGGSPYGGQQYGGQQYGGQPGQPPYPSGQQPQQPPGYGGSGYGQPPGGSGYPSGSYPAASSPAETRRPADKLGAAATVLTIVGYVCAGAGVLAFILWLSADGDGIYRFASALSALVLGIGLGGLNFAAGSWLAHRNSPPG